MKFIRFILVVVLLCQAVFAIPLSKHTFHTSLTRIDYNAKDKIIEISIQMFAHDLLAVLGKENKKDVDFENTKDVDEFILKYLESKFVLKDKSGETKKLKWIGKEVTTDTVYVYVESPSEVDLEGFSLQNSLFFEYFPEQTNLVLAKYGDKKADFFFKPGDKFKNFIARKD